MFVLPQHLRPTVISHTVKLNYIQFDYKFTQYLRTRATGVYTSYSSLAKDITHELYRCFEQLIFWKVFLLQSIVRSMIDCCQRWISVNWRKKSSFLLALVNHGNRWSKILYFFAQTPFPRSINWINRRGKEKYIKRSWTSSEDRRRERGVNKVHLKPWIVHVCLVPN